MHYSVMLNEVINALNIKSDGIYVDATLGYAGMSKEILKKLDKGMLICIDEDEEARAYSDNLLKEVGSNYKIIAGNFGNLKEILISLDIDSIDGIIYDLGFSSPQIDDASRGFSFMSDAPLDMRMNKSARTDASYIVNNYSEENLTNIFYEYGEEKLAKVIAKKIVSARKGKKNNKNTGTSRYYKKCNWC